MGNFFRQHNLNQEQAAFHEVPNFPTVQDSALLSRNIAESRTVPIFEVPIRMPLLFEKETG